ncbi:carbon-nitrogen hydrolase [Pseudomonas cichorii]|nr:carbon-nitrogen hydrolase [Pseudomonas cichorii]
MKSLCEVTVACCQLAPKLGDLAYNRCLSERAIRSAATRGAQVIVLPELVQCGYVFKDYAEALTVAEGQDGPAVSEWISLARELNVVIVAGFCERLPDNGISNSAAMVDATGLRAVYRKAHLWDAEKAIFQPGNDVPPIVDTVYGRLSILICYDLEFPEWVRIPALNGADLLCSPVNWPKGHKPPGERPTEIIRVQANASVNKMFIAACDRYGLERGVDWVQGSVIIDADGYPVAGPVMNVGEQILLAKLPLRDARNKWISDHNELHTDRRPNSYNMERFNKEGDVMVNHEEFQEDLTELVKLVRLDEQFTALLASGLVQMDHESNVHHLHRLTRIEEISSKYGLSR